MQKQSYLVFLTCLVLLASCAGRAEDKWSDLPAVTQLDDLKQTSFAITLDDPVAHDQNIVYTPAFMMAWEQITKELNSEIVLSNRNSSQFQLLNTTKYHHGVLKKDEYSVSTAVDGDQLTVKAFFNKTLPFANKLHTSDSLLRFNGEPVTSFGMFGYDADIIQAASVLFYENDDNFILKLAPEDKDHEIILVKKINKFATLNDAMTEVKSKIARGKKELGDPKTARKYTLAEEDEFAIPVLKFNIETSYETITGERFITKDEKPHVIVEAYQRTAFLLNENGAVIESEAGVTTDSAGVAPVKPKKLYFDSPFLVIVKRVDAENPYFIMWVSNRELMVPPSKR